MSKQTKRRFLTLNELFDLEDKYGATLGSRLSLALPTAVQSNPHSAPKPARKSGRKDKSAA